MLTKFCCFGQSMDFADNAKFVKRVLLSVFCVVLIPCLSCARACLHPSQWWLCCMECLGYCFDCTAELDRGLHLN